jgi:hypothetical protein
MLNGIIFKERTVKMKKNFDRKTLKSSEKCNSAKVVEKWLRHVITRRTSVRRGYLPEQGTHANKESLFASVTWLMRLPRRIQRMLLRMTIPVLALVFTLITTAESNAETWNCGHKINGEYSDSVICTYDEESKTLIIEGEGNMGNYDIGENADKSTAPWADKDVRYAVIKGNVIGIGDRTFKGLKNIESIIGLENVVSVGNAVFSYTNLNNIIIPDSWADDEVFLNNAMFQSSCFAVSHGSKQSCDGAKIICQGDVEKCKKALAKFGGNGNCTVTHCLNQNLISAANYNNCNSEKYFWNGAKCVREPDLSKRKCCDSCKDMGGWCNRIRYTPAEAAEVLHNDNTNEVTITFKK